MLALPRGGVPVGAEVARALGAPLDVLVVRKLGVPGREELAAGAIARGVTVRNEDVIRHLGISTQTLDVLSASEREELARREAAYRRGRPPAAVRGKIAVLVDDGLATGSSMLAAARAARAQEPAEIVVAVPVAPRETVGQIAQHVENVVCAVMPEPFGGVGAWYRDFHQVSDAEVRNLLA